jgi:XTP/dITP diphosphohydrolase
MKLVIATRNPHKLAEIRVLFNHPGVELLSVGDFPGIPDVEEDGDTFESNARKKAAAVAAAAGLWAMADDSGLEVDALRGAPGVRSARYAGEPVDYAANNRKLLRELRGAKVRRARFRCVVALAGPDGACRTVEGSCEGMIASAESGHQGFGYDPLFIADGCSHTFAEMDAREKNRISHRSAALQRAWEEWGDFLAGPDPAASAPDPRNGMQEQSTQESWPPPCL